MHDERDEKVLRISFRRSGAPVWLGHLDIMHAFERGLRRAGVSLKYSQGYNPRPQLVFALPLGVGVEATDEVMDAYLAADVELEGLTGRLTESLPIGLMVQETRLLTLEEAKHLMADVAAAIYTITADGLSDALPNFYERDEIEVNKWSKGRKRKFNIKPLILATEVLETSSHGVPSSVRFLVKAGSHSNLRPDLILEAAAELGYLQPEDLETCVIHREALYLRPHRASLDEGGVQLLDPFMLEPLDALPCGLDAWDEAHHFLAPELLQTFSDSSQ